MMSSVSESGGGVMELIGPCTNISDVDVFNT